MTVNTLLPEILEQDKASPFANCIRNTYQHLRKWAKRTQTDCFRIYDRALHHYPLAIDFYAGRYCIHYFPKSRFEPEPSLELVSEVENTLTRLLGADRKLMHWRSRIRRAKYQQYEKRGEEGEFFTVQEYGVKFWVNLSDYLDTGLFLDHRETRQRAASLAKGKRVLNLFSYTCSFTVHAAHHGAAFTKSVDLSNTYTDWGRNNLELNGFLSKDHVIVRADCLSFLDQELARGGKYGLIIIDPPTLSRSKSMEQMFDIQEDYPLLLSKAFQMLSDDGVVLFSTNSRTFAFDTTLFPNTRIKEISHQTRPIDFLDPKIHRCWTGHKF